MICISSYNGFDDYAFLSYSHADNDLQFALQFVEKMTSIGCRIWYDEGIQPGEEWAEVIANRLAKAKLFIVLLSKNSIKSQNVKREIYYAVAKNIPILSIYLDDVILPDGLSLQLSITQAVALNGTFSEKVIRSIVDKIPKNVINPYGKIIASYQKYEYRILNNLNGFSIFKIDKKTSEARELFRKSLSTDYDCSFGVHSINKAIPFEFHCYQKPTLFFQVFCDILHQNETSIDDLMVNYRFAIVNASYDNENLILEECLVKKQTDPFPLGVDNQNEYFIRNDLIK